MLSAVVAVDAASAGISGRKRVCMARMNSDSTGNDAGIRKGDGSR
jgi:hypothetical protein